MTFCLKTGTRVWIEETGKIYSADIHKMDDVYIVYHAPKPRKENVWSKEDAKEESATHWCHAGEAWYRQNALTWVGGEEDLDFLG